MLHETSTVFVSQGAALIGRIVRNTSDPSARQPAVVVAGSWLTVKEQMAVHYARKLAARGYTALAFDFAGWGESGGPLREAEIPESKALDLTSALRFLTSQSYVDEARVGLLCICASAQYGLRALAHGAPARAFVSVAGWFHDAASIAPFYGGPEGVARRLARADAALERYCRDGTLVHVPAYAPGDERAGMHFELDYYGHPQRGAVSSWPNRMAELSWSHWLHFDGLSSAKHVTTPTLLVHADGCALPDNLKRVHAELAGPKRLAWLDGTQSDYYDRAPQVEAAVEQTSRFLGEMLT